MPKKTKKLTDVAEIGEFGLIDLLTKEFISKKSSLDIWWWRQCIRLGSRIV